MNNFSLKISNSDNYPIYGHLGITFVEIIKFVKFIIYRLFNNCKTFRKL